MHSTSLENKCRTLFIRANVDEVSDYRRDMAIEGQVRVSFDTKIFDRSYRY